jgi:hypothetical protein
MGEMQRHEPRDEGCRKYLAAKTASMFARLRASW